MTDPLTVLAVEHGTDKFGPHDYTPNYHKMFAAWRNQPLRLLEIGVGGYHHERRGGQSLATWRDYFLNGQITGLDIHKKTVPLGERVRIYQASQVDPEALATIEAERGPFDLIVDDGSHLNEHVVESFRLLWPGLAPGGIYAVEDVQTAFMPKFGGSLTLEAPNMVGFFGEFVRRLPDDVVGIERFHNIIALHKGGGPHPMRLNRSTAPTLIEGGIVALHCVGSEAPAWIGDVSVSQGEIGNAPAGVNTILLQAARTRPEEIELAMARLPDTGLVILDGDAERDLADLLSQLWVQIDHREIRIAYPDAVIHPLAAQLRAIERFAEGWILVKAPNDYPSNLAYDHDHPQVREAMATMDEVLLNGGSEGPLLHHSMATLTHRTPEKAVPLIRRLREMGSSHPRSLELSANLCAWEGDREAAEAAYTAAQEKHPDDSGLASARAINLLELGRANRARLVAKTALGLDPKNAELHFAMVRAATGLGLPKLRLKHAEAALIHAPAHQKTRARAELGLALREAGQTAEAEPHLRQALAEGYAPQPVLDALQDLEASRAPT